MLEYGISDEVSQMKQAMLNETWIEDMESGDTDAKEELIAEVIDAPVSKALNISGETSPVNAPLVFGYRF